MNNIPCIIPKTLVGSGMSAKYFKGTAIPNNKRKETPSKKAVILNLPT